MCDPRFKPPFRAELAEYAASRLAARGRRDEAVAFATMALDATPAIDDAAERVTAVEKLTRRLVEWKAADTTASDPLAAAVLRMEAARAAKRAGESSRAERAMRESLALAMAVEPLPLQAYLQAYLVDAAATDGLPVPETVLRGVITAATHTPLQSQLRP